MTWFYVGGAAVGAAVGSYGHDNWAWDKDAIWQGALVGTSVGGGVGGFFAPTTGAAAAPPAFEEVAKEAATGSFLSASPLASTAGYSGTATYGGVTLETAMKNKGLMANLSKPMISGLSFTNPLMLGAAGMTLMSGGTQAGSSFQDKLRLSKEGEALQKDYFTAAKGRMGKAKKGDVSDRAFQTISDLKTAEGMRQRESEGKIGSAQAMIGNEPKGGRGLGTSGGQFVKGQLADLGERMTGLFAPTSTLNMMRKEELVNATKDIQNIHNIDNQTAMFSYGSSLAKWGAQQSLASQKGAALGSVLGMMGNAQLTSAYNKQMPIA